MIRVEHLSKQYRQKSGNIQVFEDLSFSLPDKGLISFVGKSGSGKTTLIRALSSLDDDYSGNIYFKNRELRTLNGDSLRQQTIGFLYQEASLLRNYTVKENILFPFRIFGIPYDEKKFDELVTALGINPLLKRKARLLSVGQRQRVALCRALLKNCPILFADEPTSSLDGKLADEAFRFLADYGKDHLVTVVTHDRERAARYSDAIYQLENGSLTALSVSPSAGLTAANPINVTQPVRRIPFLSVAKNAVLLTDKGLFTIFSLLTLIVLIPMTLSFSLSRYDKDTVLLNSYYGTNTLLSINRSLGSSSAYEGADNGPQAFDYLESKAIQEKLAGYDFLASSARFEAKFPVSTNLGGTYALNENTTWRAFSVDEATMDIYGFSLVAGRLPDEDKNEVAITRFQYEEFSSPQIQYYQSVEDMSSGSPLEINDYDDIINSSILLKNDGKSNNCKSLVLKIVGIIETHPDTRVYDYYDKQPTNVVLDLIYDTVAYTYHNAIYLPESLMNDFEYSDSPDTFFMQADFSDPESQAQETSQARTTADICQDSSLPVGIDYFDAAKTKIEDGEIAISIGALMYPVEKNGGTELVSYNDYYENFVYEYAKGNLPVGFVNHSENLSDIDDYAFEILTNSDNSYAPSYNRAYFQNLAMTGARSYTDSHYAGEIVYITQKSYISASSSYCSQTVPLRFVGTFEYYDYAAVSQSDFDVFYKFSYVDLMTTDSFVIKLTGNRSKDLDLIHYFQNQSYYLNGQPAHMQFHDPVMADLTKFDERFASLRDPFSIITYVGILLFSLLLILQNVISNKSLKRLYRLLRDFGVPKLSIFVSYSLVSLVSFILSMAFGLGFSYMAIMLINQSIIKSGGIILLLTISAKEFFFIVIVSLIFSVMMLLTNIMLSQLTSQKMRVRAK